MSSKPTPTIEYTLSVCTCGRELSSLFYFLTAERSFNTFLNDIGMSGSSVDGSTSASGNDILLTKNNMRFATSYEGLGLMLCCLKNLGYGICSPISVISSSEETQAGRKFPEALAGPMNGKETLSWL